QATPRAAVLQKRDFFNKFRIHPSTLVNYFLHVEQHYKQDNPYHNAVHAADVTQSTHVLLNAQALDNVFSDLRSLPASSPAPSTITSWPSCTTTASVLENHHLRAVSLQGCSQEPNSKHPAPAGGWTAEAAPQDGHRHGAGHRHEQHMSLLADLKTMVGDQEVAGDCLLRAGQLQREDADHAEHACTAPTSATRPSPCRCPPSGSPRHGGILQPGRPREGRSACRSAPCVLRETANVEKSQVSFIDFIVAHPLWEAWTELVHPDAEHIPQHAWKATGIITRTSAKEAAAAAKAGQET
uniref:PDEase domain-containing protein n=1 Tax=Macrostomum lignano TaxID=282301 RepID=A0A1I8F8Z1_9PLAT